MHSPRIEDRVRWSDFAAPTCWRCSARHAALDSGGPDPHHAVLQIQYQRLLLDPQLPRARGLRCAAQPSPLIVTHCATAAAGPALRSGAEVRRAVCCVWGVAQLGMRTWTRRSWRSSSRRTRAAMQTDLLASYPRCELFRLRLRVRKDKFVATSNERRRVGCARNVW